MTGFTILGAFVFSAVIAIIFILICGAIIGHDELHGSFEEGCAVGMAVVIIALLLLISHTIVNFRQNPEIYGYTRIEQEAEDEST